MEPVDHAIGRSRGGLTTKLHSLVDGHGLPLAVEAGPGQGGDGPMLPVLLERLRVPRCGPGRARTRPDVLLADEAYSSRGHRAFPRERGIKAVIPERSDQQKHRLRRGSAGGRPVSYDTGLYKGRDVVERSYESFKKWRAVWPPVTTKLAVIFRRWRCSARPLDRRSRGPTTASTAARRNRQLTNLPALPGQPGATFGSPLPGGWEPQRAEKTARPPRGIRNRHALT